MQPDDGIALVIFDADNTLRRTTIAGRVCPRCPGEWELLPGVADRLHAMRWGPDGLAMGIASNQDQVAYGFLTEVTARMLLIDLARAASGYTPPLPAIQLCPHTIEADCNCRKPNPGLLERIIQFYDVAPDRALFVGDQPIDAEAARLAGARFAWARDFFGWDRERP